MRKLIVFSALALAFPACGDQQKTADAKKTDAKGTDTKVAEKTDQKKADQKKPDAPAASDAASLVASLKAWSAGDVDGCLAGFTDDIEWTDIGSPEPPTSGKDNVKKMFEGFRTGFPDSKIVPVRIIDGGDVIAVQMVSTGTHTGDFMGTPATGKAVGMHELMIAWTENGKIKKGMGISDAAGMMAQLGLVKDMPAPAAAEPPTGEPEVIEAPANAELLAAAKKFYGEFSAETAEANVRAFSADGIVGHNTSEGKTVTGIDENIKELKGFFKAFPDFKAEQADVWGAGDWIFALTRGTGTHKGDLGPIKATNKPVTMHYAEVCRAEGGKLVECWGYMNGAEMMGQLGLLPKPTEVAQK